MPVPHRSRRRSSVVAGLHALLAQWSNGLTSMPSYGGALRRWGLSCPCRHCAARGPSAARFCRPRRTQRPSQCRRVFDWAGAADRDRRDALDRFGMLVVGRHGDERSRNVADGMGDAKMMAGSLVWRCPAASMRLKDQIGVTTGGHAGWTLWDCGQSATVRRASATAPSTGSRRSSRIGVGAWR